MDDATRDWLSALLDESAAALMAAAHAVPLTDPSSAHWYSLGRRLYAASRDHVRAAAEPEAKAESSVGSTVDVSGPPVGSDTLIIDLGFVPKMNEDEEQCMRCRCVRHESEMLAGMCRKCVGEVRG